MLLVSKGIMNGPETTGEAGQIRLKTLKSELEIKCGKPFVVGHIWTCNQTAERKSGRFNPDFLALGGARGSGRGTNISWFNKPGVWSGTCSAWRRYFASSKFSEAKCDCSPYPFLYFFVT